MEKSIDGKLTVKVTLRKFDGEITPGKVPVETIAREVELTGKEVEQLQTLASEKETRNGDD